ncbi:hypothetical protein [uncultured Christiangramia sp.]|uniref:hypothetical protein n=1 Tax=uncultured Christiangramia sp. TaxID=503836 RepID=UPI00261B863E|nr:hypothetical protein [uncultured Christiangramia sp.]
MDQYEELIRIKKMLKLNNSDLGSLIGKSGDTFRKAMNRKSLTDHDLKALVKSIASMNLHNNEDERLAIENLLKDIRKKVRKNRSDIVHKILSEEDESKLKDVLRNDPEYRDLFIKDDETKDVPVNQPLEIFQTKNGSQYEELANGKYVLTVPLVPVRAQARYVYEFTDAEYIEGLTKVSFIVDRVGVGVYRAFEIQNDSMDDDSKRSITSGSYVCGRELSKHHWKDKLRINHYNDWIIVHQDTILCKQIIDHDVEKGIITCHSLNTSPEYQDFEINLNEVKQLFNIISVQNMRV